VSVPVILPRLAPGFATPRELVNRFVTGYLGVRFHGSRKDSFSWSSSPEKKGGRILYCAPSPKEASRPRSGASPAGMFISIMSLIRLRRRGFTGHAPLRGQSETWSPKRSDRADESASAASDPSAQHHKLTFFSHTSLPCRLTTSATSFRFHRPPARVRKRSSSPFNRLGVTRSMLRTGLPIQYGPGLGAQGLPGRDRCRQRPNRRKAIHGSSPEARGMIPWLPWQTLIGNFNPVPAECLPSDS